MKCKPILIASVALALFFVPAVAQAQDTTPPQIVSTASLNGQKIGIAFNEALDATTAQDPLNYSLNDGATVTLATLRPNATTVELEVSGLVGSSYTVTVNGVRDLANNSANTSTNGVVMGFTPEDIGFPAEAGSSFTATDGTIQVRAGGFDTWFNSDSFHFAHQERTGDFDVRVQVKEFVPTGANVNAKGLLMVRESADASSRHIATTVFPTQRFWGSYQRAVGFGVTSVLDGNWQAFWPVGVEYPNAWMRLKRVGNTFTTYGSSDGDAWIQVGNSVTPVDPYPETVLLGVGATSAGDQFPGAPMVNVHFANLGNFSITNATVLFTQQPTNMTVVENVSVTFRATVEVTGTSASNLNYQWLRGGVEIPGATAASYTIPVAATTDDAALFRVRVSLPGGGIYLSDEAVLTVHPDTQAPAILSVASLDSQTIGVRFNEVLNAASAQDVSRYTLTGGAVVTQATLMPDGRTVVLIVSSLTGTTFNLSVNNVTDLAGNGALLSTEGTIMGWIVADIGSPVEPGSAFSFDAGDVDVRAGGADIWGTADSFNYVYQQRTGDFDVAVQMARLDYVTFSTRGGLMVREDLAQGSRNLFVGTYPENAENKWLATVRSTTDGGTTLVAGDSFVDRVNFAFPNAWFRVKRVGNTFTSYYKTNGVDWVQLADQLAPSIPYPDTVYLGVATVSITSTPGTATIAHYRNFGDVETILVPELVIERSGKNVVISWPQSATDFGLESTDNLMNAWSPVVATPDLTNGRYQLTLPAQGEQWFYRLQN